jgi:hypothetical protein
MEASAVIQVKCGACKMTDTKQKPEPAPVPSPLTKEQLDRMVKEHRELIHPGLTEEEFHDLYYGSGGSAR